jgi:hypothetical protein
MADSCSTKDKPKTIKEFFKSSYFWKPLLGIIIGGIGGYLIYYYVGCHGGQCSLIDKPLNSIFTGSVLGYLVTSSPCLRCREVKN